LVKKRDIGEDERALWEAVTKDVRRPARRRRAAATAAAKPPIAQKLSTRAKPQAPVVPKLSPPPLLAKVRRDSDGISGVDGGTAERLRRGRIEPDAKLDLHGMTQAQAFTRLLSFVRRGHENGSRCLLVITGKGSEGRPGLQPRTRGFVMPERSKAGVLRSLVPFWLEQGDIRPLVVGIQEAHQKHGGSGALYVYLRRKTSRGR